MYVDKIAAINNVLQIPGEGYVQYPMKFRTKLYLGFGTILALFIIFTFIVYQQLSKMNTNMHDVVGNSYVQVSLGNALNMDVNKLGTAVDESLLDEDTSLSNDRKLSIEQYKYKLSSDMVDLDHQ